MKSIGRGIAISGATCFRRRAARSSSLVADPAHRLAQRAPPDLRRNDLGHLGERGLDGVGMIAAAMRPQQLRQAAPLAIDRAAMRAL